MSELTQQQIEDNNRRELWKDVEASLRRAYEAVEYAQGALEDLRVYGVDGAAFAELLTPHVDALRRAANDAGERT